MPTPYGTEVAWWCPSLDVGSGSTLTDFVGGFDGTLQGSAAWVSDTDSGGTYAISLPGTASNWVTVPDNSAFSFTDGSTTDTPVSISLWAKFDQFGSAYGGLLSKSRNNASGTETEWALRTDNTGQLFFTTYSHDTFTNKAEIYYASTLSTATWYHIGVTYDGSEASSGMTLYIDGSPVAGTSGDAGTYQRMFDGPQIVGIGGAYNKETWRRMHDGLIDDIRIFSTELSASDMAALATTRAYEPVSGHANFHLYNRRQ